MKKKILLAIGVIVLFIGMAIIPGTTAIKDSQVESLNDTRYKFSAKAFLLYSTWCTREIYADHAFILGTARIEGECSKYSVDLLISYIFTLSTDADYATVHLGLGSEKTYHYDPNAFNPSMVSFYLLPWTIDINEISE